MVINGSSIFLVAGTVFQGYWHDFPKRRRRHGRCGETGRGALWAMAAVAAGVAPMVGDPP